MACYMNIFIVMEKDQLFCEQVRAFHPDINLQVPQCRAVIVARMFQEPEDENVCVCLPKCYQQHLPLRFKCSRTISVEDVVCFCSVDDAFDARVE